VIALFTEAGKGTRVDVFASAEDETRLGKADFVPSTVLAAAKDQTVKPAL
jgi:hypothetical protein